MSVQLPIHNHGLIFLRDVSQHCSFKCKTCDSPVKGGPAYHCPQCRVVYHKSCADPAHVIHRHPFHPAHPLVLRDGPTTGGKCSLCDFPHAFSRLEDVYGCTTYVCKGWIHGVCAAAFLPPSEDGHREEEEGDVLRHFAHHEHPLEPFVANKQKYLKCKACWKKISGRVYGCVGCAFILHESCALLPLDLQDHPFHPRHHHLALQANLVGGFHCKACPEHSGFAYCCKECDFILGLCCAASVLHTPHASQNFEDSGLEAYSHISHPHNLISLQATRKLLQVCNICRVFISGDFFCCSGCLFMLHKSCANCELSGEIVLPFHPEHSFMFPSPDDKEKRSSCFLCSKLDIRFDYRPKLKCKECPTWAHIACAVELLYGVRAGAEPIIQNIHIHPHQMARISLNGYKCTFCSRKIPDLGYVCCEEGCQYCAHIECATAKSRLKHPFHPRHPLILHGKPLRESAPCNACLLPFNFFEDQQAAYCCDVCNLQVHTRCAMQKLRVKHPRHKHDLTYFEVGQPERLLCNVCFENCSIDLYRCVQCNYNLHYACMYLPPTVQHKDHIHSMVLRDRYIVSHLRLDDQYCDLCETIRDPDQGVYYCDMCDCSAHIDCVIPKHEAGQSKLLDPMILNLDKEIERENIKKEELMSNMEELMANVEKLKQKIEVTMYKLKSLENRRQQMMSSRKQEEASSGNE